MRITSSPVLLMLLALHAGAAVIPDRTRAIFNAQDKASSLKIENQSRQFPYLAYGWIENSDGVKSDDDFAALPPVQRLEPGGMSQIRIVRQAGVAGLPQDRESLFYFNLREIPPKVDPGQQGAVVQMALQTRIKLFYRPAGLVKKRGEPDEVHLQGSEQNGSLSLTNPGPYFITLAYFGKDSHGVLPGFSSVMLPPFGQATLSTGSTGKGSNGRYLLGYIDDYGALKMLRVECNHSCTFTPSGAKS